MGSISKSPRETKILELCGAQLESVGFRIVDVDCHLSARSIVRLFIERPDESASIEDCAHVARTIGPLLDAAEDLIPGGYELEVSSPGLDRRLRLAADFTKVLGEEVKLELHESIEGRGTMKGKLVAAEQDRVLVAVDNREIWVPLEKVRRANRVWQFKK